jgi:hypothetical protein
MKSSQRECESIHAQLCLKFFQLEFRSKRTGYISYRFIVSRLPERRGELSGIATPDATTPGAYESHSEDVLRFTNQGPGSIAHHTDEVSYFCSPALHRVHRPVVRTRRRFRASTTVH